MANEDIFKKVISHSKEYGFVFPSSEIYDGLGAVYDYGQNGSELKKNIKDYWWKAMVQFNENVVGIDSSIFMHPTIWKASGHVDSFNDPMIDNKDSNKRYRADELIESKADEYMAAGNEDKAATLLNRMSNLLEKNDLDGLRDLIIENDIVCPISNTKNWTSVRQFNLMFSTKMGSTADEADEIYLRPETAQGIFVNFINVQKTGRMKIPFGIAQIGKAFRNEIIARQFIMRMREFEQMEMQFFVRPGEDRKWYEYWKEERMKWHLSLGINKEYYRYKDHVKLAHYANAAVDIEYMFPFGFKEVEGIHSRTDFDLKQHQEFSGKKLQYFDPEINKNYIPYVIETSIGVDRMFLVILCNSFKEEEVKNGDKVDIRTVLNIPPILAPYKVAILPLVKKDGLPEKAREIMNKLKPHFNCFYDEKDAIGKRYRRQDAIGTPYCVTIDYDTFNDGQVTIRNRDNMFQERISIDNIEKILFDKVNYNSLLK
ncbi:MAG: glycine--tRNA ligase [Bacteroidota bacterium]|nr:glycine--tRNA ligase [Bacteroidota bacterium]